MGRDGAAPTVLWIRRALRFDDHPALAALAGPALLLFVRDESVEAMGAAARMRLGQSLAAFERDAAGRGLRLVLRSGPAVATVAGVAAEVGAGAVHWTQDDGSPGRAQDLAQDQALSDALAPVGIAGQAYPGAELAPHGAVLTRSGTPYTVFTPFWRALRARDPGQPVAAPLRLRGWRGAVSSERLADWRLDSAMFRGAAVTGAFQSPGEVAARLRLADFLDRGLQGYAAGRDRPDLSATSGLSEHLAWGEISPRRIWAETVAELDARPALGAAGEKFLSELGWRAFAWATFAHRPDLADRAFRPDWDGFPWQPDGPEAEAWRRARTGEDLVDAGLREMFVTGRMHNRVRMVVASYLTKHLLTDWRVGLRWFAECLTDWDPAANAFNWQWVAGSGADAAPYFRIFNPRLQADRFDPEGAYRRHWLEGKGAAAFAEAIPRAWGPPDRPGAPLVTPEAGRARALAALARARR